MAKTAVFLLLLVLASPLYAATPAEDLFQKALVKETLERDVDGAIHIYQQVVDQAKGQSGLAAEARLRIGLCFEKLGKTEYAERAYRQIVSESSGVSLEIAQQARTHLRQIEAERRVVSRSSSTLRGDWVSIFHPSRFSLLAGPALLLSSDGAPITGLAAGFMFRLSPADHPLAWFVETQGTLPLAGSTVGTQTNAFDSRGNDTASLSFRYQASLGLMRELPHGQQRTAVPEVGVGLALTAARISYVSPLVSGDRTRGTVSPYLETGVHFFPDRIFSLRVQVRYISTPYLRSIDIQDPPHSQTFNFPSSQWAIGAALQIKIGYWESKWKPRP